ncbi:hypothetical protein LUZ60_007581 [Juncus effusus]|nr:hypothetical protein LUZ60_007581 [Juncus effusus]
MSLHCQVPITCSTIRLKETTHLKISQFFPTIFRFKPTNSHKSISFKPKHKSRIKPLKASKAFDLVDGQNHESDSDSDSDSDSENSSNYESPLLKNQEEREKMRRKIREMLDKTPKINVETDPAIRKEKIDKLLKEYSLVVDEEDPDWPEEYDEGWGFNFGQFFNKISIKNEKNENEDDEGYNSEEEIVWQDDDYIKPIQEIKIEDWEKTVFVDFNPLVILVHNRYRRPKENERARIELVKAVEMFWGSNYPSPRCVGIDACVELELIEALKITTYPEILFTQSGKILHRDKVVRTAEEWAQIMSFFYYKARRPSCLDMCAGQDQEKIPSV